jgi:thiol-disulfide isomerase/thioredoxin
LVEQRTLNPEVEGSIPSGLTKTPPFAVTDKLDQFSREAVHLLRPVALILCLLPAPVRAEPKTIEITYTKDGKMVQRTEEGRAAPGRSIRNVAVDRVSGLVRQRGGKATLFVLYASHCPACRKFLPRVARLGRKLGGRGLSILAFSIDEDEAALRQYIKTFRGELEWLRIRPYGKGRLKKEMRRLGTSVVGDALRIPVYALFDGGGRVLEQGVGAQSYEWLEHTAARALPQPDETVPKQKRQKRRRSRRRGKRRRR